jgi:endonuclease/exonuclease/phosphatase family metal-dependent hydrolase
VDADDEERAADIASAICSSAFDYDIIALNEVWEESLKEILVDGLTGSGCAKPFDYYEDYVNSIQSATLPEDSGLMIFSRLEFDYLVPPFLLPPRPFWLATTTASTLEYGAFVPYLWNCANIDCLAAKGAALVRVSDPSLPRDVYVAFTHLQADDEESTREDQMDVIDQLLSPLTASELEEDVVVLMGDLNIKGNNKGPQDEWTTYFAPGASEDGGFWAGPVEDAWDRTTSPEDPGYTSPGKTDRLDYIVASDARGELCVQHMRLAFPGLSDHLGLNADINADHDRCSPRKAAKPNVPAGGAATVINGNLADPGGVQWYRFEDNNKQTQGGTWSFDIVAGQAAFEVYEARDLSDPIAQYFGETTTVTVPRVGREKLKKFLIPSAPFYVKVFVPDRYVAGGAYKLAAYQSGCSSANDACALYPYAFSDPADPELPTDQPVNADDTFWYSLHTEAADSGIAQMLEFDLVETDPALGALRLQLRDQSTNVLQEASGDFPDDAVADLSDPSHPGNAKLFLTVKRDDANQAAPFQSFKLRWRTDLTVLHARTNAPLEWRAVDETGGDAIGDDEMEFEIRADNGSFSKPKIVNDDVDTDDFVCAGSWHPIRFVENLEVRASEHGDLGGIDDSGWIGIGLAPGEASTDPTTSMAKDIDLYYDGDVEGTYRFYYNLSRQDLHDNAATC